MADVKKLHPQQWLGRPILSPEHVQDLETRAAINEFHHKLPRHEAEQRAHDDYVKEHRERAAAHHLSGMKAAMATGNHEDARKHWAMYDLHLKALGKDAVGTVPPEIEKRMMDEGGDKPIYKFKAHKGDLYALHEPSKDVAPPAGQAIQKSEGGEVDYSHHLPEHARQNYRITVLSSAQPKGSSVARLWHGPSLVGTVIGHHWDGSTLEPHSNVGESHRGKGLGTALYSALYDHVKNHFGIEHVVEGEDGRTPAADRIHQKLGKSEAKQCKWKLGERRCQRMVNGDYCHDHVDHWANKIKQKEAQPEINKAVAVAKSEQLETADSVRKLLVGISKLIKGRLGKAESAKELPALTKLVKALTEKE